MTDTIQHEKGKADVIANGPGTVRRVPEGEGEKEAAKDGFVNGIPVSGKDQAERDHDFADKQAEGKAPEPDEDRT